jgi:hypothetical protein
VKKEVINASFWGSGRHGAKGAKSKAWPGGEEGRAARGDGDRVGAAMQGQDTLKVNYRGSPLPMPHCFVAATTIWKVRLACSEVTIVLNVCVITRGATLSVEFCTPFVFLCLDKCWLRSRRAGGKFKALRAINFFNSSWLFSEVTVVALVCHVQRF